MEMESQQDDRDKDDGEVDPYVVAKDHVERMQATVRSLHYQRAPPRPSQRVVAELVGEREPEGEEGGQTIAEGVQTPRDAAGRPSVVVEHAGVDVNRHPDGPEDRRLRAVHGEDRLHLAEPAERTAPVHRLGEDYANQIERGGEKVHQGDVNEDFSRFGSYLRDEHVGADYQTRSQHGQRAAQ